MLLYGEVVRGNWLQVVLLFHSPPFSGSDQMMTYTLILKGVEKMDFPKKISKRPDDLIRKLCRYLLSRVINCLYIVQDLKT